MVADYWMLLTAIMACVARVNVCGVGVKLLRKTQRRSQFVLVTPCGLQESSSATVLKVEWGIEYGLERWGCCVVVWRILYLLANS